MVLGGLLPDSPVFSVLAVVVATGVVWVGSGLLEDSAEQLSTYYGLPAVVQGSVVVAVGSSFPELSTVVVAALLGTFNMGVGAIIGSAIFNILVIPALSGLVTDGHLESNRTVVYKETQFYMISVAVLLLTFSLAVIYYPVTDGPALEGTLTRPLALIPLLLYGLYLFIQWEDVSDHDESGVPDSIRVGREWSRLAIGLLVILVAVEALVTGVETLSHTYGIPEFLAGATIIAAATGLPDTLVSVRAARQDKGITSLGNTLGSNTFDLLVAVPVGVLIVGRVAVDFSVAVPLFGVLTVATILLFTMLRTDLWITENEAYTLLLAYALFIVWIIAETLGATHLIKGG